MLGIYWALLDECPKYAVSSMGQSFIFYIQNIIGNKINVPRAVFLWALCYQPITT